ncbi:hypothetical protein CK203_073057 [Vitis vinifera]|uniref:Uncharacterized protein n=1 Tax=Vitis vinifera TaxID=29760 RepID=A0A438BY32_VITVI|nr:hypothetical protein CK203_073057 [Vitis vinifera]
MKYTSGYTKPTFGTFETLSTRYLSRSMENRRFMWHVTHIDTYYAARPTSSNLHDLKSCSASYTQPHQGCRGLCGRASGGLRVVTLNPGVELNLPALETDFDSPRVCAWCKLTPDIWDRVLRNCEAKYRGTEKDMKSGKAPGATNTMQQFKKSGNMRRTVQPYMTNLETNTCSPSILSRNYRQPKRGEPWVEVKFKDENQRIRFLSFNCSSKKKEEEEEDKSNLPIGVFCHRAQKQSCRGIGWIWFLTDHRYVGNQDILIQCFRDSSLSSIASDQYQFILDIAIRISPKSGVLVGPLLAKYGWLYYKYVREIPFALTGSLNLAKATSEGNTVILFVARANDK